MSVTVRNISDSRRVWPTRHFVDGHVLVLNPGEEGECEDAQEGDPFLEIMPPKTAVPAPTPKTDKTDDLSGGK